MKRFLKYAGISLCILSFPAMAGVILLFEADMKSSTDGCKYFPIAKRIETEFKYEDLGDGKMKLTVVDSGFVHEGDKQGKDGFVVSTVNTEDLGICSELTMGFAKLGKRGAAKMSYICSIFPEKPPTTCLITYLGTWSDGSF